MRLFELNEDELSLEAVMQESVGPIIIDFYASWCGPCTILGKRFDKIVNELIEDSATIIKVNVEENPETSKAFKIKTMPTCVYILDGELSETKRTTGLVDEQELKKFLMV